MNRRKPSLAVIASFARAANRPHHQCAKRPILVGFYLVSKAIIGRSRSVNFGENS